MSEPIIQRDAAPFASHGLHVRAVRTDSREADFVASTNAIDRYDEIVEQVWDLRAYEKNPVVLFGHNSCDLPVGQCTHVGMEKGQLVCRVRFLTADANPKAEQVWQSVVQGALRAVSVGFIPHEIRVEKRADREVYVLSNNELLEISVVPIPANPEALARAKAKAFQAARPRIVRGLADDPVGVVAQPEQQEGGMIKDGGTIKLTETIMDDKNMKAALDAANAKLAELETLRIEKRALEDRATHAEERAGKAEESRESTQMQLDACAKALGPKQKKADGAEETLAEQCERIVSEMIERDVDALVGKKLTPAQKATFLALAKKDRASFDAIVAGMPELKLSGPIMGTEKDVARADGDLADHLDRVEAPSAPSELASLL